MAIRDPFTDPFVASQDPLCLSPEDGLRPPASKTLSVSPYEGENLVPEVGRTGPCEGETLLPEVGQTPVPCVSPLTGENKRGLPARGAFDFPIG